jgi:hypothetical protein
MCAEDGGDAGEVDREVRGKGDMETFEVCKNREGLFHWNSFPPRIVY